MSIRVQTLIFIAGRRGAEGALSEPGTIIDAVRFAHLQLRLMKFEVGASHPSQFSFVTTGTDWHI